MARTHRNRPDTFKQYFNRIMGSELIKSIVRNKTRYVGENQFTNSEFILKIQKKYHTDNLKINHLKIPNWKFLAYQDDLSGWYVRPKKKPRNRVVAIQEGLTDYDDEIRLRYLNEYDVDYLLTYGKEGEFELKQIQLDYDSLELMWDSLNHLKGVNYGRR